MRLEVRTTDIETWHCRTKHVVENQVSDPGNLEALFSIAPASWDSTSPKDERIVWVNVGPNPVSGQTLGSMSSWKGRDLGVVTHIDWCVGRGAPLILSFGADHIIHSWVSCLVVTPSLGRVRLVTPGRKQLVHVIGEVDFRSAGSQYEYITDSKSVGNSGPREGETFYCQRNALVSLLPDHQHIYVTAGAWASACMAKSEYVAEAVKYVRPVPQKYRHRERVLTNKGKNPAHASCLLHPGLTHGPHKE